MTITPTVDSWILPLASDIDKSQFRDWARAIEAAVNAAGAGITPTLGTIGVGDGAGFDGLAVGAVGDILAVDNTAPLGVDWLSFAGFLQAGNWLGVSIASAATCDIGATVSNRVSISGTAAITSFGTHANSLRVVTFQGALVLTHDAVNLALPSGANILTAANDRAIFVSNSAGQWHCVSYQRADGSALKAFVGDTGTGGAIGLVPAPAAGDAAANKVLGAGGAWVTQSGGGGGGSAVGVNYARRNGGFEIWQRLTNGASTIAIAASTTAYTVDGWYLTTGASQACTITQAAGLTSPSNFAVKVQRNSGQTGTGVIRFAMPLDFDELLPLRGNYVCLSFMLKEGANQSFSHNVTATLYCGTAFVAKRNGTAYTGETSAIALTCTTTTTATRFQATSAAVIPTNVSQAEIQFTITPSGTAGADDSFSIDDLKLEVVAGSSATATAYVHELSADILPLCQKFLPVSNHAGANGEGFGFGGAINTTTGFAGFNLMAKARVAPTGILVSSASHFSIFDCKTASVIAATGVTYNTSGVYSCSALMTVASGLVAGSAITMIATNAAAQIMWTGAEI